MSRPPKEPLAHQPRKNAMRYVLTALILACLSVAVRAGEPPQAPPVAREEFDALKADVALLKQAVFKVPTAMPQTAPVAASAKPATQWVKQTRTVCDGKYCRQVEEWVEVPAPVAASGDCPGGCTPAANCGDGGCPAVQGAPVRYVTYSAPATAYYETRAVGRQSRAERRANRTPLFSGFRGGFCSSCN